MKYLIFLVFCGSLVLEANGMRVRVFVQDSEKDGFSEVTDTSARRAIQVKKRFEKRNPKDDPGARWKVPKKERNYEYEQSVAKILKAVKKIMIKGEPLLYPKSVGCETGVALKCQYTPNKTEDELFFGYQDKPQKRMMRVTDSIDKLISHPVLRTYVDMLDYSTQDAAEAVENVDKPRAQASKFDIRKMKVGKLLMFVKRVVYRDPGEVPQKFVCGIQIDKEKSTCNYYVEGAPANSMVGFRLNATDVNNAVKSVFTSQEVMKAFIKLANDAAGIFPALRPGRKQPGSDNARVKNTGMPTAQESF